MAEQSVTLASGESREISFEVIPKTAKIFQVKVNGLFGSFTAILITGELHGRVYDMYTNEPLAGAKVTIGGQIAYTDSNGEYGIPALPIGSYDASFSKRGYETTYYQGNLTIEAGTNIINVGLVPAPTLTANVSGTVTDPYDGLPIPGVQVTLTGYRATGDPPSTVQVFYETLTDSQGQYAFTNVLNISYSVSFIKESYETKVVGVDLAFEDKTVDVQLTWIGTGLRLYHAPGGTLTGFAVWDAVMIDINTMQAVPKHTAPGALIEPHMPIDFELPWQKFLLLVMEMPWYPEPGPYWYGPYLVEIPEPGKYTWSPSATTAKIDGHSALNLPFTPNEADVVAVVEDWGYGDEAVEEVQLKIISASPVAGKENVAGLYVGQSIRVQQMSGVPVDTIGNPLIPVGKAVLCKVSMVWGQYAFQWKAWGFVYPREYPDSAYEFFGGLVPEATSTPVAGTDYHWSAEGNVSPFSMVVLTYGLFWDPRVQWQGLGPNSGSYFIDSRTAEFQYLRPGPIYAHPDPNKVWRQETWQLENWVRVA